MSLECMFLGSLSRHNKDLEQRTLKPSQTVLQLLGKSVLQLYFIYKIAGESKTRREESGRVRGEGEKERERECARMHTGERVPIFATGPFLMPGTNLVPCVHLAYICLSF